MNIDNARRYTQERSTALTLQRSLLPQHVPEESAVEMASRYLPSGSRAGVGGDWFDVIPLSGARVALVVGDVIGHGLHAAATMGRLRTAVRTLADIDLPPDELLTHLDDVVIRLQREGEGATDEISATCLYAIYDPVSRTCSLASAGHIPPAVVTPQTADGAAPASPASPASPAVNFPELPIGPPLGLGGLPSKPPNSNCHPAVGWSCTPTASSRAALVTSRPPRIAARRPRPSTGIARGDLRRTTVRTVAQLPRR